MNAFCVWSPWRRGKWLTVGGCLLLMFPISIPVCWGNIGIYALSYIAVRGRTTHGVDTPWIISIYYLCICSGIFLAGMVKEKRTKRIITAASVVMYAGGLCLTYLTVQMSVALLTLSVGVLSGIAGGLVNGMALQYAGAWAENDPGLVISLVLSGGRIGTLFINPLFTLFVNPSNLSPSISVNSIKLFSQAQVLDKVPFAFIVFGAISFLLHIIGLACVKDVTDYSNTPGEGTLVNYELQARKTEENDAVNSGAANSATDSSLREVFQSPQFYALSLVFLVFENISTIFLNYYKAYGVVWISDDLFLALMGMPYVICSVLGYSLWGFVSDRLGVKKTLIYQLSTSSWLFVLMYFSPMWSRWLYTANILLIGLFFNPIYPTIAVASRFYFGNANHNRSFFLVVFLGVSSDLYNPIVLLEVLSLGWFYVFFLAGCLCAVALIIAVLVLPDSKVKCIARRK